jgi:hypothetical protein
MIENGLDPRSPRALTTRRAVVGKNIKAIGAILASALVAGIATPAHARTVCFLKGTRIRTMSGERKIEELAIGDMLPTVFGGAQAIQWITSYRRTRRTTGKPWMKDARPVCIKSAAIAPGVPHNDLYVTPGHALLIDDLLVPAGSLVNGTTIVLCPADDRDELEFFQIKLESHDAIYAEGAPCETLLSVGRSDSTFGEYCRRYGTPQAQARHCAPIVCNGARSEIRSRVRGAMSPWLGPQKIDWIRDRLEERALDLGPVEQSSVVRRYHHQAVEATAR